VVVLSRGIRSIAGKLRQAETRPNVKGSGGQGGPKRVIDLHVGVGRSGGETQASCFVFDRTVEQRLKLSVLGLLCEWRMYYYDVRRGHLVPGVKILMESRPVHAGTGFLRPTQDRLDVLEPAVRLPDEHPVGHVSPHLLVFELIANLSDLELFLSSAHTARSTRGQPHRLAFFHAQIPERPAMTDTIITPISLEDLAPDSPVAQSRLARLVLSFMTADPLMSTSVFTELSLDPRGVHAALNEAIIALTEALASEWTREVPVDDVVTFIRSQLAGFEGQVPNE
jgi:hypothetical protein